MANVNVGLIGLGNIGSGVVEIIQSNADLIQKRTGVGISIVAACSRSKDRAAALGIDPKIHTTDYRQVIANPEVTVVVELVGGYEPARTIILDAINAKKHVITANKAVLAKHGYEIFEAASKNGVNVLFEASVGGCIPIIRTIEESYSSDNIESIYGILNGTTNYILTRMAEGMSYEEALGKAQQLGFAEADPSFDVEGKDASQKLSILASLAFDARIEAEAYTEGITKITKHDLAYASELGYAIKLLAIACKDKDGIVLHTHPTLVPKSSVLANVSNEFNAILLKGKNTGELFLSGKGAGKLPTATVVVTDIIEMGSRTRITQRSFEQVAIKPFAKSKSRFFLRLDLANKPGVLAKITKVLGDNSISIAAFSQKEDTGDFVSVVIITHAALEGQMENALKECKALDVVKPEPVLIRIADL